MAAAYAATTKTAATVAHTATTKTATAVAHAATAHAAATSDKGEGAGRLGG